MIRDTLADCAGLLVIIAVTVGVYWL